MRVLWIVTLGLLLVMEAQAQSHFQNCYRHTGNKGTIVFPKGPDYPFAEGDEIAVLTPSGACAGVIVWTEAPRSLTIWGDDMITPDVDGYEAGDTLVFRLFDGTEERVLEVTYDRSNPIYQTDVYRTNGVYVLSEVAVENGGSKAVGVEEEALPAEYALAQNYPNPFNPSTVIPFDLPAPRVVRLRVYDMLGREVARLVDGSLPAGRHRVAFEAGDLGAGVYVYVLQAGDYRAVRQMVLLK
ncbi:MAG: hypothetical protein KatS3mg042_1018 [Rhodothermaceae bacterium]|nr:MAG: hypothetical protein KatS3mg042_1018 [Rhodothermaceae bacterium]